MCVSVGYLNQMIPWARPVFSRKLITQDIQQMDVWELPSPLSLVDCCPSEVDENNSASCASTVRFWSSPWRSAIGQMVSNGEFRQWSGAGSPKCQKSGILTGSVRFLRKPPSSATHMKVLRLAAYLRVQESVCALCFALYGTLKKRTCVR